MYAHMLKQWIVRFIFIQFWVANYQDSIIYMTQKVIWLLTDGIGDVSIPKFHNKTPLQVAKTPHLDAISGL